MPMHIWEAETPVGRRYNEALLVAEDKFYASKHRKSESRPKNQRRADIVNWQRSIPKFKDFNKGMREEGSEG